MPVAYTRGYPTWIEVEDDRFPAEGGQPDGLAAVADELEVRCGLAFLDHPRPPMLAVHET